MCTFAPSKYSNKINCIDYEENISIIDDVMYHVRAFVQ